MATQTTLTALPSAITAGDSLLFSVKLSDYTPSAGWSLSYLLKKETVGLVTLASTTGDNDDHLFSEGPDVTGAWPAGKYYGIGRVTDGTNYKTISEVTVEVYEDMAQVAADYDPRSYARKCLDAVESVMYRRSGFDLVNTVIAGQSVSRMTPEQLAFWRNYFKAEVDAEQAAIDMANGKDNGKNILIRFN